MSEDDAKGGNGALTNRKTSVKMPKSRRTKWEMSMGERDPARTAFRKAKRSVRRP